MSLHRLRELIENYAQSYADAQANGRLRFKSVIDKNELELEIERLEKLLGDE